MNIAQTPPTATLRFAWQRLRRFLRTVRQIVWRAVVLLLIVLLLGDGVLIDRSLRGRTTALARDELFDYATWELHALWDKVKQEVLGVQIYLDAEAGHRLVLDYLATVTEVQRIEWQIEQIYADPTVADPATASADLRAQRDDLRDRLSADQLLVESIIEGQVSTVLADQGFGVLGQVLPPVSMHFSEIPTLLVVSPRDRIEYAVDINLVSLTVEERAALEAQIDAELDVSSLVVSLGGLSLYPSMIIETTSPARALEVTAHEWTHHYLMFFPLGQEYSAQPETRIINETTATFVGREVARQVIERYYPELEPPDYPSFLEPPPELAPNTPLDPDQPEPFDYGRAMHETRVTVDDLLAQGQIEEAEAYMEARRRVFVDNGYAIRKLNQAYFAFYGGYQGEPGAGGTDPIGPAVEQLLRLSPDLQDFLRTMRDITTREDLLTKVEQARAGH